MAWRVRQLPQLVQCRLDAAPSLRLDLTRSEAHELYRQLREVLVLSEPYIPRLPWYRRIADAWRAWRARGRREANAGELQRFLMEADKSLRPIEPKVIGRIGKAR